MTTRFYKCEMCGNVVVKLVDSKVPIVCCGQKMQELVPNTVDASNEKHVPVVTRLENNTIKVEVGSVAHPMTEAAIEGFEHDWEAVYGDKTIMDF